MKAAQKNYPQQDKSIFEENQKLKDILKRLSDDYKVAIQDFMKDEELLKEVNELIKQIK